MTESDRIKEAMLDAAEEWASRVGDHLLAEAVGETPILTGALRASGRRVVVRTPYGVTLTVTFDEVYARYQHERRDLNHPRGGKAKYLEDPLKRNALRYVQLLAAAQRRAVARL